MADFNFTSQICTTREQSERLLALGLKKETADMCWRTTLDVPYIFSYKEAELFFLSKGLDKDKGMQAFLPAWSLHRLLEILGIWYLELWFNTDVYEQVITHIQERVEGGLYNKKFFEDQKQIAMEK